MNSRKALSSIPKANKEGLGQIKFVAAVIIMVVLLGVFAGFAKAHTLEDNLPDFYSCDILMNDHRYTPEKVYQVMDVFNLETEKSMHNFIRDCDMLNTGKGYWDQYMEDTRYYHRLMEGLRDWRGNKEPITIIIKPPL
ncbi:hypothetical protein [Vibrio phage BONAISHI]|nr:hypothetical protein [Vibrio phage BONAISHI]